MRIIGLTLALLSLTSAQRKRDPLQKNPSKDNNNNNPDNPGQRKKIKVKVQGKLLSANTVSDGNTCYPMCNDVFADSGCEVMNGSDQSLGTFYCKIDTPCAPGEKGEPSFTCDMGGISIAFKDAEDLSTSCGGVGFDLGLMVGRDDYEKRERGTVYFPSTCECDSCGCNPCEEGQKCKSKWGGAGFMCLGKKN